ncbi:penicillin-binding protein 2 [bacterium (Candidatus Gribaldobacteria) CG_4_10_14_0_8_um_filter_33_9]|uniref:Penicillin-binding protein 2 n=1 Tax=bacterium (Candidatus Gribaldobacteria) CG_4_10_14_0_8_um_filter_33_9 TaxID=2014266 RepID=A0A2M7RMW2_9BACT|nr:MAG: penicillin-binding protein 2 [bacterium (Candidatus Gribaldobacteria) CG_4_10_14_0_8_um_filter_33_9]
MKKINSHSLDIEETFLDHLLKNREQDSELLDRKIEFPLRQKKVFLFFIFGLFFLALLLIVCFKLQILEHKKYNLLSQKNNFLNLKIAAERGIIYDRNMKQLVFNQPSFNIFVEKLNLPKEAEKRGKIFEEISKIFKTSKEDLEKKVEESHENSVLLKNDISRSDLILMETRIKEFPGIKIKEQNKRNYFEEETLSHILGYLGKISPTELKNLDSDYEIDDYTGKEGLEKEYEKILAEEKGFLEIERDAHGKEISQKIKKMPRSGQSLVLFLNLDLQKKIADTLRTILKEEQGEAAMAVALDPRTGEVLASVSLPAFDNNLFSQNITQEEYNKINTDSKNPQLNRIISGTYPVGSTIKPLIGIAALEEGVITKETTIFCPLNLCLENKYTGAPECFSDWQFHGWTNIKKAIAESVNSFFYIIGGGYETPKKSSLSDARLPKSFQGLGVTKINLWLERFGWGKQTGIDLPGEAKARVPTSLWKEDYFASKPLAQRIWYRGDTYNLSIGQGYLLATPIQVATAFQFIANQGKIFKPKIVKEVLNWDQNSGMVSKGKIQEEILKQNFVNSESIETIRQGMREAVTSLSGSAAMLNSLPVHVAAKTGTAQVSIQKQTYHNWITVFAPYENPEILLVIVFENVKGLKSLAQKATKEILTWYFTK